MGQRISPAIRGRSGAFEAGNEKQPLAPLVEEEIVAEEVMVAAVVVGRGRPNRQSKFQSKSLMRLRESSDPNQQVNNDEIKQSHKKCSI